MIGQWIETILTHLDLFKEPSPAPRALLSQTKTVPEGVSPRDKVLVWATKPKDKVMVPILTPDLGFEAILPFWIFDTFT